MTARNPVTLRRRIAPPVVMGAAALAAAGAALALRRWGGEQHVPLPPALDAPLRSFVSSRAGRIAYYADDQAAGRPLVLVHSVNAAASAFEMRPLFERLRGTRPVYALDLPGFGFSDRSARRYSPELYAAAIADFVTQVAGQPADIVALSLGSEFAARAALEARNSVASLAFISPSGFDRPAGAAQNAGRTRMLGAIVHGLLTLPLAGQAIYNGLSSRPSIRYYSDDLFADSAPEPFVEYAYATAHQPGARHAPFYFLSGLLFTPGVRDELYSQLSVPVLVLYDQDPFVSFDHLPAYVAQRPNWHVERIVPTYGLPHWDIPAETAAALERFWAALR